MENIRDFCQEKYGLDEIQLLAKLQYCTGLLPHYFEHVPVNDNEGFSLSEFLFKYYGTDALKLSETELAFIDQITTEYRIMQTIWSFGNCTVGVLHELTDFIKIIEYQCYGQICEKESTNVAEIIDKDVLSMKKQMEQEKFSNPENLKTLDSYTAYLKNFIDSETDTIRIICDNKTKEEKIKKIESYIQKVRNVDSGKYFLDETEINLKECESVTQHIYSDYLDIDGYWKEHVALNQLLILYSYYRLTGKMEVGESFFKKTLDYIKKELPDSKDKYEENDIDQYFHSEQLKTFSQTEQHIARSCNNLFTYYNVLIKNKDSHFQSKGDVLEHVPNKEFQEQEFWTEQEVRTKGLEIRLELLKLCGEDPALIENATKKLQEICNKTKHEYDVKNAYQQMKRTMDILFVFIKGLELYKEADIATDIFPIAKVLWKLRYMDLEFKKTLFSEPYLYEEHIDQIKEMKSVLLERNEGLAKEEEALEEKLDTEIELEESEEKNKLLRLELERKSAEVECMKGIIKNTVAALKGENIDAIVQKRLSIISDEKMQESNMELVDELSNAISSVLQKRVEEDEAEGLKTAKKKIEVELGQNRVRLLTPDIIQVLSTAEYLYGKFIEDKDPIKGFDYSCISTMYYQALEKTYNYLMYSGYISYINSKKQDVKKLIHSRCGKKDKWESFGYFPKKRLSDYVINVENKIFYNKIIKNTCEYGNFIYLLNCLLDEELCKDVIEYKKYLCNQFHWKSENDPKKEFSQSVKEAIQYLCEGLDKARERRNNASHGGIIIKYKTVKEDKYYVYLLKEADESRRKYKKLIFAILDLYNL